MSEQEKVYACPKCGSKINQANVNYMGNNMAIVTIQCLDCRYGGQTVVRK